MRILSVASTLPYPPDDGTRIRICNFLKRLAATEDVTLLTWVPNFFSPSLVEPVKEMLDQVIIGEYLPAPMSPWSRVRRRIKSVTTGVPPYVLRRMEEHRLPTAMDQGFDLAIAEDDGALFLMPEVDCPIVVHRHNIFSDTIESLAASGGLSLARRMKWKSELPTWRRYDRELSRRASLSLVTTHEAKAGLLKLLPGASVEVIPNGVELPDRKLVPGEGMIAVFIGAMDYEPNVDAVVRFAREAWPPIRRDFPEAVFRVVGRDPLPAVRSIEGPGIEITGGVPDIVQACEGARLGVVPLNAGSGIKNKTLELMAMGLPVIATPRGCEGMLAGRDEGLLRVEDLLSMEIQIRALFQDRAQAIAMGAAARNYVAKTFSWDAPAEAYIESLRRAALERTVSR